MMSYRCTPSPLSSSNVLIDRQGVGVDGHSIQSDVGKGSVLFAHRNSFHRVQGFEAVNNLAENRVFIVKMRLGAIGEKEL
mmetsp:Transcript_29414/g.49656  ORF Transcript_29414/g.49656 Transcript_29414/m.49656 type:complete len:80 (-) Transcript_29414:345-584(-)